MTAVWPSSGVRRQNTYHTLQDMRVVLVDGTVLDTSCAQSRDAFQQSHGAMLDSLSAIASRVQNDSSLMALIRQKCMLPQRPALGGH